MSNFGFYSTVVLIFGACVFTILWLIAVQSTYAGSCDVRYDKIGVAATMVGSILAGTFLGLYAIIHIEFPESVSVADANGVRILLWLGIAGATILSSAYSYHKWTQALQERFGQAYLRANGVN